MLCSVHIQSMGLACGEFPEKFPGNEGNMSQLAFRVTFHTAFHNGYIIVTILSIVPFQCLVRAFSRFLSKLHHTLDHGTADIQYTACVNADSPSGLLLLAEGSAPS